MLTNAAIDELVILADKLATPMIKSQYGGSKAALSAVIRANESKIVMVMQTFFDYMLQYGIPPHSLDTHQCEGLKKECKLTDIQLTNLRIIYERATAGRTGNLSREGNSSGTE